MAAGNGRKPGLSLVSSDADVAFYVGRLTAEVQSVMVLGGAHVRLIWALAEHAQRVQVVDPSESMLEGVEDTRADKPGELSGRVQALSGDLRAVRLNQRFDLVLAPHNALSLVGTGQLEAVLTTVAAHLTSGGCFVFDVLSPPRSTAPHTLGGESGSGPPRSVEPQRPVFTPHLRGRRRPGGQGSPIHRLLFRPFSSEELDHALKDARFTPLERYGNFTGKPFDLGDAIQVVVAGTGR